MDFWERAKAEIRRANTTQEWVAKNSGVSLRTFQGWISRGIMPNADQALAIARSLGVTVEYLVTGTDPKADPFMEANRDLLQDLKTLSPSDLSTVKVMVAGVAAVSRARMETASGS